MGVLLSILIFIISVLFDSETPVAVIHGGGKASIWRFISSTESHPSVVAQGIGIFDSAHHPKPDASVPDRNDIHNRFVTLNPDAQGAEGAMVCGKSAISWLERP